MKLTVITPKQSTLVNLNGLENRVQMNTRDLSGIAIVKRMKLQNTAGRQIATLARIIRKLLIGKAETIHSLKNPNHINKISYMLPEIADDTSLFCVVKNVDASNIDLNNDLKKISEWAF